MNHIIVFSELSSGKLKNLLSGELPYKDVLSLVKAVNTKEIFKNIPASQVYIQTESFNFQAFGYKSVDDFKFITTTGKTTEFVNVSVTPVSFYELHDNFKITPAPDKRSRIILGLLIDEFERIKNRALYQLVSSTDESNIKVYAIKNRQLIKTCFHNHKAIFHDLFTMHPDYLNHPDAYIHYYVNFFLIRLRLFYEKLFEDFLTRGKKIEKQLMSELFQMNPLLWYQQNNNVNIASEAGQTFSASEPVQQGFDSDTSLAMAIETVSKAHKISPVTFKLLLGLVGKLKWNGKKNILGDAIYQMMQMKDENGLPWIDASTDTVASLVSLLFIDSAGNPLSKATIKTLLSPSKSDKRPKKGANGKIDII